MSEVDRNAEAAIIEVLHKAYPEHGIIGEESGTAVAEAEYTWIIDPLDGTANFLQGIPHFAVSIALRKGNHIEQGVIVDPVRNEEFVATRGAGAQLNGKRIRVARHDRLDDAVIGMGMTPSQVATNLDANIAMLHDVTAASRSLRRQGSAAPGPGLCRRGAPRWLLAAGPPTVGRGRGRGAGARSRRIHQRHRRG